MSDTRMEKVTNMEFINRANGRVLIAGLGIGLLLENLGPKLKSGEVTEIVVVEKNPDVIALIGPFFKNKKIKIIEADIFEFIDGKFDTIYFDIWKDINTDNLAEIKILSNRFKGSLNRINSNAYMNSWMKEILQQMNRADKRAGW